MTDLPTPVTGHQCIEAEHYREECNKLRTLLGRVEASSDRFAEECDSLRDLASAARYHASMCARVERERDSLLARVLSLESDLAIERGRVEGANARAKGVERLRARLALETGALECLANDPDQMDTARRNATLLAEVEALEAEADDLRTQLAKAKARESFVTAACNDESDRSDMRRAQVKALEAALAEACDLYELAECVGPTRTERDRIAAIRATHLSPPASAQGKEGR